MDYDKIKNHLKDILSPGRYVHSENTANTAEHLAIIYNQDRQKAYIAGLVHDCTREVELKGQHQMISELGLQVDELTLSVKELLHAYTAETVIRNQFEIVDEEIISAVRYHTTGKEDMTTLQKIIFLADIIEPSRSFPGVEYIRHLSTNNMDEALLAAFDSSIRFLIGKRSSIHPNTFFARNYVLNCFKE